MTVRENLSAIRFDGDQLLLWRAGNTAPTVVDRACALPKNTVFAAPSDAVRLVELDIDPEEVKHLNRSLPFILEDNVVDDIDDLHFARLPLSDNRWLAAVMSKNQMAHWQAMLGDDFEGAWLPECLLLPWQPGEVLPCR